MRIKYLLECSLSSKPGGGIPNFAKKKQWNITALWVQLQPTKAHRNFLKSHKRPISHLVNEGCKFVVEDLNLFLLLLAYLLDGWVNFQVEWGQEIRINSDFLNTTAISKRRWVREGRGKPPAAGAQVIQTGATEGTRLPKASTPSDSTRWRNRADPDMGKVRRGSCWTRTERSQLRHDCSNRGLQSGKLQMRRGRTAR